MTTPTLAERLRVLDVLADGLDDEAPEKVSAVRVARQAFRAQCDEDGFVRLINTLRDLRKTMEGEAAFLVEDANLALTGKDESRFWERAFRLGGVR